MDNNVAKNDNKVLDFIKDYLLSFAYIFSYAFTGLKACTFDVFVYIYNSISWKTNKNYRRTKDNLKNSEDNYHTQKKKKQYKYSARTMAKLEEEYKQLAKDLQTTGATRSKEVNIYLYKVRDENGKIIK